MKSITEQIMLLEKEFAQCPNGYISRKVINGKERFYLQWTENGKIKSSQKYYPSEQVTYFKPFISSDKKQNGKCKHSAENIPSVAKKVYRKQHKKEY
jgi:hypothetical protein